LLPSFYHTRSSTDSRLHTHHRILPPNQPSPAPLRDRLRACIYLLRHYLHAHFIYRAHVTACRLPPPHLHHQPCCAGAYGLNFFTAHIQHGRAANRTFVTLDTGVTRGWYGRVAGHSLSRLITLLQIPSFYRHILSVASMTVLLVVSGRFWDVAARCDRTNIWFKTPLSPL